MTAKSPLGNVIILKIPLDNDESKREFYELFKISENILFYGIDDESQFLQVIILEKDAELINTIKTYGDNIIEIDYSDLSRRADAILLGNKLLLPYS